MFTFLLEEESEKTVVRKWKLHWMQNVSDKPGCWSVSTAQFCRSEPDTSQESSQNQCELCGNPTWGRWIRAEHYRSRTWYITTRTWSSTTRTWYSSTRTWYSRIQPETWTANRKTAEGAGRSSSVNPTDTGASAKATGEGCKGKPRRIRGITNWFGANLSAGTYNQDRCRQTIQTQTATNSIRTSIWSRRWRNFWQSERSRRLTPAPAHMRQGPWQHQRRMAAYECALPFVTSTLRPKMTSTPYHTSIRFGRFCQRLDTSLPSTSS